MIERFFKRSLWVIESRVDMTKQQNRILLLILLGYVLVSVTYALATPPLESSDEYKHYPVVQHIQTTFRLPVLDPDEPGLWLQEAVQPPLYYVLMAGLTFWIDTSDLPDLHQVNPHAFVGNPNQVANKNLIIHRPTDEQFPWQGSVLAVYVIRLATILLGMGTIVVTARLGALLHGPDIGLLAAALTAFNPMFLFVHAAVNNDALSILLGSLGLYLLVNLWRDSPDPRREWSRYVILGAVLGLGIVTKLSLAGLLALAGLALAWLSWRRREWRHLVFGGSLILAMAMLLVLPWIIRNWQLYENPTALNVFIEVQATRDGPITWQGWVGEFGTFYRSYWGLFGGVNIAMPEFLYSIYNLLALAGVIGFAVWIFRGDRERLQPENHQTEENLNQGRWHSAKALLVDDGWWLLIAWSMLIFAMLLRWNINAPSFQGRLVFSAIGAVNIILASGLLFWVRPSGRRQLAIALALLAFVTAAVLPWTTIRPAYQVPASLNDVPNQALFGPISFGSEDGEIQLVGVQVEADQSVSPGGDPIEVTLYWQATGPIEDNLLSAVNILGRNNESIGHVNRYPASGMVPTSLWQPGQIWRDEYLLFPSAEAEAPTRLKIRAAIFDSASDRDVSAYGPDGTAIDLLVVGEARLAAGQLQVPSPGNPLSVTFSDGITLQGIDLKPETAEPGDQISLTLYWRSDKKPSQDYTVFVHLLDDTGRQIVGADSPPVLGDYPTSLWREDDQVLDKHILNLPADLPPGPYIIAIGLYTPDSGRRVPLVDGSGDTVYWPVDIGPVR